MSVAALESLLERRWHGAAVHGQVRVLPGWQTGISSVDLALSPGGIPRGRLTEIFGGASSGKTTLAYGLLAACTQRGEIGAYVDPQAGLFAPAAHDAGIDLHRLIVIRAAREQALRRAIDALVRSGACAVIVLDGTSADALQTHHYARLVAQAERNGTTLLALSNGHSQPLASFASLRLGMRGLVPTWQAGGDGGARLCGYAVRLDVAKSRASVPGKSATFEACMPAIAGSWPTPEPRQACDPHEGARERDGSDGRRSDTRDVRHAVSA